MISLYGPKKRVSGTFQTIIQCRAYFVCVWLPILCIFNLLRINEQLSALGSVVAGGDKLTLELITILEHSIND